MGVRIRFGCFFHAGLGRATVLFFTIPWFSLYIFRKINALMIHLIHSHICTGETSWWRSRWEVAGATSGLAWFIRHPTRHAEHVSLEQSIYLQGYPACSLIDWCSGVGKAWETCYTDATYRESWEVDRHICRHLAKPHQKAIHEFFRDHWHHDNRFAILQLWPGFLGYTIRTAFVAWAQQNTDCAREHQGFIIEGTSWRRHEPSLSRDGSMERIDCKNSSWFLNR